MAVVMTGNWIDVRPGEPAFDVMTNRCKYFEIGQKAGRDIWLEGQVLDGEFVFNGRLILADASSGTILDNFPKGPTEDGWKQRRRLDGAGYELLDANDEVIFSYRVDDNICSVDVNLYQANGELAAHGGQGGFVAHVPIRLGRGGIVIR